MHRGTTPTFLIELPQATAVSEITAAYLTFAQTNDPLKTLYVGAQTDILFEKTLSDMTLDTQNNTLAVVLTQEETLRFIADKIVHYQLRFTIGGSAYATQTWAIPAESIIKDGII